MQATHSKKWGTAKAENGGNLPCVLTIILRCVPGPKAGREKSGRKQLRLNLTPPRQISTLPAVLLPVDARHNPKVNYPKLVQLLS